MSTLVPATPGGAGTSWLLIVVALQQVDPLPRALSFSIGMQVGVTVVNTLVGLAAVTCSSSARCDPLRSGLASGASAPRRPDAPTVAAVRRGRVSGGPDGGDPSERDRIGYTSEEAEDATHPDRTRRRPDRVSGHRLGESRRIGEIREILGAPGHEHHRVLRDDDRESIYTLGSDATIQHGHSRCVRRRLAGAKGARHDGNRNRIPDLVGIRVVDAMHPPLSSCSLQSPLRTVARMMATYRVHEFVVSHGNEALKPTRGVGRRLRRGASACGRGGVTLDTQRAGAIATTPALDDRRGRGPRAPRS